MWPDMLIVEMADTKQHTYSRHDTDNGSRLPKLPASGGMVVPCPMAEQGESLLWKQATAVMSRI